jgi:hypothetical protein
MCGDGGKGGYKERILRSFNGRDGERPYNIVILDSAGNLYGTTFYGGSSQVHCGGIAGCGVAFELTP